MLSFTLSRQCSPARRALLNTTAHIPRLQLSNLSALLATAVATILLDQASKSLVMRAPAEAQPYTSSGSLGLRRTMNARGGVIRMCAATASILWLSAVLAIVVAVGIASRLPMSTAVALGLVVGGATGNLADRVTRGAVVDFIAIMRWPTFNLADAAMSVGTAMTVWSLL